MHNCCNNYTRSKLLRSAAAEAGKGLPAIEPGMPTPAGTGLSRRSFLSWSAGLALSVYGASKIPLAAFEEGIAQAAQGDKILVSVFFDGGIDALSVLAPVGDPRYSQLRPNLALSPEAGTEFTEDNRLRWHPAAEVAGDPARRGESQRLPGDRVRPSRPVPLHLAPLLRDRRARDRVPHRLARPLPRPGRDRRQPAAGALDGRPALADDRHRRQAGRGDRQRRRLRPLVRGRRPGLRRDVQQLRQLRLAAGRLARPRPGAAGDDPDREAAPGPRRRRRLHQPRDLPRQRLLPQARRSRRLHRARPAAERGDDQRRGRLRHPRRPGRRPRPQPARNLRRPARLPARPRGAGARRPGPGRDVERVRPPPRRERLRRDRPRGRRLRVRDRVESEGRDGRRIPRPGDPRRQRQPACDQRLPRRCTARCSRNGSATTPPRSSPARPGSRGRPW